MGLFKAMFKEIHKHGEAMLTEAINKNSGSSAPPKSDPLNPPTRWEKAVVALNGIVTQVSQIDPDGVDIVCFGGGGDAEFYRNVKDTKGLEAMVTAKPPMGDCHMGAALQMVIDEAMTRGFENRPCSILIMTAGRPDDTTALNNVITETTNTIAALITSEGQEPPLTITFVQVGDDPDAEQYLKHLDDNFTTVSSNGKNIDIVDTIKDEEIKTAIGEIKSGGGGGGGTGGALLGAFAGAALGVGGMYLMNKMNAKKRTEGWNGTWKASFNGDEIATLTVTDDQAGNLTIEGFPEGGATTGSYAENEEEGYNIQFADPNEIDPIFGTVEDNHTIVWSDGTRWEEIPPAGTHWAAYVGAGAAGAAVGAASLGATGHLLEKKFFRKAAQKTPSDYVIILDRSAKMAIADTGK